MDYGDILKRLWHLRLGVLAIVALGVLVALVSRYDVRWPPGLASERQVTITASGQILVDAQDSPLADAAGNYGRLANLAALYSAVFQTTSVRPDILEASGLPPTSDVEVVDAREQRDVAPAATEDERTQPPRIAFAARAELPLIDVEATAPTLREAEELVRGGIDGVQRYLRRLQEVQDVPPRSRIELRQLGDVEADETVTEPLLQDAIVNGVAVVVVLLLVLLVVDIGLINPPPPAPSRTFAGVGAEADELA